MKPGYYHCRMARSSGMDIQDIMISVKSAPKRYTLKLIEDRSWYKDGHIKMMFKEGKKVIINKDGPSAHALIDWGDDSFTIYPFRNGVPFYFVAIENAEL